MGKGPYILLVSGFATALATGSYAQIPSVGSRTLKEPVTATTAETSTP
jgi:hypothetical protein